MSETTPKPTGHIEVVLAESGDPLLRDLWLMEWGEPQCDLVKDIPYQHAEAVAAGLKSIRDMSFSEGMRAAWKQAHDEISRLCRERTDGR